MWKIKKQHIDYVLEFSTTKLLQYVYTRVFFRDRDESGMYRIAFYTDEQTRDKKSNKTSRFSRLSGDLAWKILS